MLICLFLLWADWRDRVTIWPCEESEEGLRLYFVRIGRGRWTSYRRIEADPRWKRSMQSSFCSGMISLAVRCAFQLHIVFVDINCIVWFLFQIWMLNICQLRFWAFLSKNFEETHHNRDFRVLVKNFENGVSSRCSTSWPFTAVTVYCLCCSSWT